MRFNQKQHPFEDLLSLKDVSFLEQLAVKLAQSIYVSDDRS